MSVTICNFSNVYGNQPYLEGLKLSGKATWINLSDTSGTDCYCDDEAIAAINGELNKAGVVDAQGIHFIDNGNYHYMSKFWTDRIAEPFTLVVFDHHPDMQEPRFGDILSCGGWVKKVLDENKFIDNVVIIGVADNLVKEIPPHDKVSFICESEIANHTFHIPHFTSPLPLYISIDKDALSTDYAATNWDQSSLSLEHMKAIISAIAKDRKIIGVDICGEQAQDFSGDEHHTVQEADTLNDRTNQELVEFLEKFF